MYGELATVRGIVDLSAQEALNEAEAFLTALNYTVVRRTNTTLTVERRPTDHHTEQAVPNLTVAALPQPGSGVRMTVRGNDQEGVQAKQIEWAEWAESLPKKPGQPAGVIPGQEPETRTADVELSSPQTVERVHLPSPPHAANVAMSPPPQPPTITAPPPR